MAEFSQQSNKPFYTVISLSEPHISGQHYYYHSNAFGYYRFWFFFLIYKVFGDHNLHGQCFFKTLLQKQF